jgi:hypothetical protein
MSRHKHRARHPFRRILGLVAVAASVTAVAAPAASAAGILPSTTTVTASSPWVTPGDTVALTATVKVLGLPGLGVLPTGSVTFSSPGATSAQGSLGFCLLKTCTASASMVLPVAGTRTITATYSGDLLAAASSSTTAVTVYAPAAADSTSCPASQVFCSAYAETGDCSADSPQTCVSLDVTDANSSTARTVNAALITGDQPSCADDPANPNTPWALFSSTSPDARKLVQMEFYGPQATALAPLDGGGNLSYQWFGCYTSNKPFTGYLGGGSNHNAGTLGPAPLVGGFYQAKLPKCDGSPYINPDSNSLDGLNPGSPLPCVALDYSDNFFGTRLDITIETTPGDPKYIPT